MIKLDNVVFNYQSMPMVFDLQIQAQEKVAIIGESGAGKSTLLNLIAGFEYADSGEIWLNGENHTGHQQHAGSLFPDIAHPRILMEFQANTMSADFFYNCVAIFKCMHMNSVTHISNRFPWFYLGNTDFHAFLGNADQLLLLRAYVSDAEHTGRIGVIAI